jgi:single-strand DNA-binding protein
MFNKIILIERLTADPEFRQTQTGIAMCNFNIAIDRPTYGNNQGNNQEKVADFFRVTTWRYAAEFAAKYFKKGSLIIVEGKAQNNNYTDQQGVKHYSMQVIADNVSFGETRASAEARGVITGQNQNFQQNDGYNQQQGYNQQGYNTTPQNFGQNYNPQAPQTAYNQPNYAPNQGQQYNSQIGQNQGQYNPQNTQITPNGAAQTAQNQQNTALKDFDEIISDGDVPF